MIDAILVITIATTCAFNAYLSATTTFIVIVILVVALGYYFRAKLGCIANIISFINLRHALPIAVSSFKCH